MPSRTARGDRSRRSSVGAIERASARSVSFVAAADLHEETVDIRFDGHRVWSAEADGPAHQLLRLEWPENLRPELTGETELSIALATTGELIATAPVRFDDSGARTAVVDGRGRWLAVNKWGNLGVPLESQKKGARKRLLKRARRVMADLEELGFRPFLSSGSLLGAIRNGRFLPHDDDIDLGNLTDTQHPAALVVESERLEHALRERGYTVVRHSHAHLQLVFKHKSGDLDHYIDVFTAYFDPDGTFNQPFSIRGELARDELEPYSVIELEGKTYPAPAVPEKWLALNYGPGWRIPDPGYQFDIPERTRRRFDSWFGTFNLHRDFWEARQADLTVGDSPDLDLVLRTLPSASHGDVVDVGAGISGTAIALHARGWTVTAADFGLPALFAQDMAGVDATRFLNLNDRHSVLEFALDRAAAENPASLLFEHVLEGLSGEGKENALLLMRWVLRDDAIALVSFDTDLPADHTFDDPTSWHLPFDEFTTLAESQGLDVELVSTGIRTDIRRRERSTAFVVVRRHGGETS